MNENMKAFLSKVSSDQALIERLNASKSIEEILAFAKELGFELTEEDIKPSENIELSENELAAVSGGAGSGGCGCAMGGGGGGKKPDGTTYGCACLLYGQGGDGSATDFTCVCTAAGVGFNPDEEE